MKKRITSAAAIISAFALAGTTVYAATKYSAEDLKKLAAETWEQRKNKAREAGSKASTKLLFPMMLFSFPALFILILGPAFISMMRIW